MNIHKLFILCLVVVLSACVSQSQTDLNHIEQSDKTAQGDKYWTLDFFHFYKGKQTHKEQFQFVNRRDCFDTLYQMQFKHKKDSFYSGSGMCTKLFVDGQQRTHDDLLGYR